MRITKTLQCIPVFALVGVLALPAAADVPDGGLYLGGFAGWQFTLDDWDLAEVPNRGIELSDSVEAGLRLGVQVAWWLAIEAELGVLPVLRADLAVDEKNIALHTAAQAHFLTYRGDWVPYVSLGVGGYHNVAGGLGTDNDFELHWGLGLKGMISDTLGLRLDVVHRLTDGFEPVQGDNRVGNNLSVTVGVDWYVIREDDSDQDGVLDALDRCPRLAGEGLDGGCPDTDGDGFPDDTDDCPRLAGEPATQGCPDTDCDAIADARDACPNQPGAASAQGCPDRDGDSVVDADDRCPDQAGTPAHGGCVPATDRDNDGVGDVEDQCPDVAGTASAAGCPDRDGDATPDAEDKCPTRTGPKDQQGCADTDGDGLRDDVDRCPDEAGPTEQDGCLPAEVQPFRGRIAEIYFGPNKAGVRPESHHRLDRAYDVLRRFPKIRVRIQGHTDHLGNPKLNLDLSRRRAVAVMRYLIDKGIPKSRLEAIGFGDTRPEGPNNTPEGRAHNRRIEFEILSYE